MARQLRGQLELLRGGGIKELPLSQKAKGMATKRKPKSKPAAKSTAKPAKRKSFKPVNVDSVAVAELKKFKNKNARELEALAEEVRVCDRCELCETRTQTVFGSGNPRSPLMIIGEAPGGDEDAKGLPFVGRSGKLLGDIIEKGMKYKREDVYIVNVLKCRPPHNRNPKPAEIELCREYLERQIEIINPKVIITVGLFPAQWMTGQKQPIGKLRGQVHEVNGRAVIPTYHPAYLLRNYTVDARKKVHHDVMLAVKILGEGPLVK
ncbi:uracil-DNA glycosylase [Planctomycetota bacterium]|nr:uracil-DNA glycosylase [Planctomycetota bacterium]